MAVCSLLDNAKIIQQVYLCFLLINSQLFFFKKAKRLATWEPFSFFNQMEKHNRVNSRTRTKRGGIFITAAFTLI